MSEQFLEMQMEVALKNSIFVVILQLHQDEIFQKQLFERKIILIGNIMKIFLKY
jgi:hypothetical protein